MFERLKKAVKGLMMDASARTGIGRKFKNIFELGGVPAFEQFYTFGIFPWKMIYRGYYEPWHKIAAPSIAKPYATRKIEPSCLAKAVCAELAGLCWSEECAVVVSQGDGENQPLNDFVQDVLRKNNFWTKMQEHLEQVFALGGGALKVWYEQPRDREGNPVPGRECLRVGYCMADQFVPTAWDNARVTEGVFISREAKNGFYYTRLEWHKWDGLTYWITNELYRAEQGDNAGNQDILGIRVPLAEIYPLLNEETTLEGLDESLFTYYRPAAANNLDDNSPLGVSVYANAMTTLHALDICFDSFMREFRLGRKRIIVPAQAVRTVVDPETGEPLRYFDDTDEAYEALATDGLESLKIQDNTVELRVEEHIAAINAFLSILCLQLGFSAGTFTFDRAQGLRTATEVISENSKTFKTIRGQQSQLRTAIERLIDAIIRVGALYDVQYDGYSIRTLAAQEYERKVTFDDSILQDRQTNINEGILLTANGLMSKKRFLVETIGMTEAEADAELAAIRAESPVGGAAVDFLNVGGTE